MHTHLSQMHAHKNTCTQTHTHTHTHTQSARRAYDAPHGGQSCLIVEQVRSLQTTTSLTGEAATVMKKQHLRWSSLPRPWSPVRHARKRPEARTHAYTYLSSTLVPDPWRRKAGAMCVLDCFVRLVRWTLLSDLFVRLFV